MKKKYMTNLRQAVHLADLGRQLRMAMTQEEYEQWDRGIPISISTVDLINMAERKLKELQEEKVQEEKDARGKSARGKSARGKRWLTQRNCWNG